MATHHPTYARPATSRPSRGPIVAAVGATAAFAFLAFRLSFEALTALAAEHGVDPDVGWMFAVLVDGGAVVGTVGVVAAKRAGRRTRVYWGTVVAFAAVSLAFNVEHSDGTGVGVAIAVVPPVAQLVATELLVRMLPAADTVAPADVAPSVAQAVTAARTAQTAATAAQSAADAARAALDTAEGTVADAVARAEQAAASLTAATEPPLALVDLAAAVAAVEEHQAVDDVPTDAPAPLPLAAVFTAPPLPTPSPLDDVLDGDAPPATHRRPCRPSPPSCRPTPSPRTAACSRRPASGRRPRPSAPPSDSRGPGAASYASPSSRPSEPTLPPLPIRDLIGGVPGVPGNPHYFAPLPSPGNGASPCPGGDAVRKPITDEDRDQVRQLHAEGMTRNAIARAIGRSGSTVSKIAGDFEPPLSFERGPEVVAATDARRIDLAARRAQFAERLHESAERLHEQLFAPCVVGAFGGKDNLWNDQALDRPRSPTNGRSSPPYPPLWISP